jgi:hypothetical protein
MEQPCYPVESLLRISAEKQIPIGAMFTYLISSLNSLAVPNAIASSTKAQNKGNAYNAIQGMMGLVGRPNEIPADILEVIQVYVFAQLTVDRLNATAPIPNAQMHQFNVKVGEALYLAIQEIRNNNENQALQARMHLEKRGIIPPPEPPKKPDPE